MATIFNGRLDPYFALPLVLSMWPNLGKIKADWLIIYESHFWFGNQFCCTYHYISSRNTPVTFSTEFLSIFSPARPVSLFPTGRTGQKPSANGAVLADHFAPSAPSTIGLFAPETVLSCVCPSFALGPHLSANADFVFNDDRALFSIACDDALRCQTALQGRHVYFN